MLSAGPSVTQKGREVGLSLTDRGNNVLEEIVGGSDVERGDATRIASIPPARLCIPSENPVVQVSCGLHHTGKIKDLTCY